MNLSSLKNKNVVDGKVIMTEPHILFFDSVDVVFEHIVALREEGRPDLISLKFFGDHSYTDLILKFNGISNPFSMSEGDVVEIPQNQERYIKFIKPTRSTEESKKEKFMKERRLTQKDVKRLEYLQSIAEREALPPNRLKTGDLNKRIDLGEETDLNPTSF